MTTMTITNEKEFLDCARLRSRLWELACLADDQERLWLEAQADIATATMAAYDSVVNHDRKGQWMMSGTSRFWPEDPRPQDIRIEDVAHGLSCLNRFNGRTIVPYSVAEHSVYVSRLLPPELRLFGLLHDAAEGMLGDVISPVKRLVAESWDPIEERVMLAVAERYGFAAQLQDKEARDKVKWADLVLLATEIRDLSLFGFSPYRLPYPPNPTRMPAPLSQHRAEAFFLAEFRLLCPTHPPKSVPTSPCMAEAG